MEQGVSLKPVDLSRARYVGFWKRVGANVIDVVILLAISVPLMWWTYGVAYFTTPGMYKGPADVLVNYVLPAIAAILFWKFRGATPGKMLVAARIVDAETGAPPSTGQLIGRYFAYLVSILGLGLGFLWIAFDRRKQGWHDKLAGTVVIYEDEES
jgi:uncharacterized RDD family membrane protein YckC